MVGTSNQLDPEDLPLMVTRLIPIWITPRFHRSPRIFPNPSKGSRRTFRCPGGNRRSPKFDLQPGHGRNGQVTFFWDQASLKGKSLDSKLGVLVIGNIFAGWWLTRPSEKYESQLGLLLPNIWKNQKCSKPPTSWILFHNPKHLPTGKVFHGMCTLWWMP